jgi:asparagine synthetase B (glutamine-hydrolysing)
MDEIRTRIQVGPDHTITGVAPPDVDRHVALGHRRLAVIDLAGGVQPMQAQEEGRTIVSLTYSGKVYNFVELREHV